MAPGATATANEPTMTEQESFLAIQAMLQSSVAIIARLRDLVPFRCFVKEQFASLEHVSRHLASTVTAPETAEQRTFSGTLLPNQRSSSATLRSKKRSSPDASERSRWSPQGSSATDNPFSLLLLGRGRTAECDQLLHWIDVVLQALKDHQIDAVNFTITKDPNNQINVLESYTLFFEYHTELNTGRRSLRGMSLSRSAGRPVAVTAVTEGLDPIINGLIIRSIGLPRLPDKRFLSCHVRHSKFSSFEYSLEGFERSRNQYIYVPEEIQWRWAQVGLGAWHSGVHTVALSVGYLAYDGQGVKDSRIGTEIPPHLPCSKRLPRLARTYGRGIHQQPPENDTTAATKQTLPEQSFSHPFEERPQITAEAGEPSITDPENLADLISALDSTSKPPAAIFEMNSLQQTQELPASLRQDVPSRSWQLKPGVMQRIRTNANLQSSLMSTYAAGTGIVRCQCGSKKEEGELIRCVICDTTQHRHCYGFLADTPAEEHVCYRCLLKDLDGLDGLALEGLKELAKKRRILWLLYDRRMHPKDPRFRKETDCYDEDSMDRYMTRLTYEGYFETHPQTSKQILVMTPDQMGERRKNFGDPTTYVASFYNLLQNKLPSASSGNDTQEPRPKRARKNVEGRGR